MKAKVKKWLKRAALITLGAVLFGIGYITYEAHDFIKKIGGPWIQSDYSIRTSIEDKIGFLPASAHHLYYANRFLQEPDYFIAFSASANDCNDFLLSYLKTPVHLLKPMTNLPERVAKYGPDSWGLIHKDQNWDLSEQAETFVYNDKRQTVLYSASNNRIFICLWGL